MNEDVFAGQWRQLRGTVKSWWGNLSDDDFEWVGGQKDRLIGLLQQKYGWTREQAQNDIDRRLQEYEGSSVGGLNDIKARTYAMGETAANRAREAFSSAADGFESARSYVTESDFSTMAADFREFVRKYPFQTVLIAAGVLYLMFRNRD
jgi:uncharacterized protein YjbJ (UPF0337 family)